MFPSHTLPLFPKQINSSWVLCMHMHRHTASSLSGHLLTCHNFIYRNRQWNSQAGGLILEMSASPWWTLLQSLVPEHLTVQQHHPGFHTIVCISLLCSLVVYCVALQLLSLQITIVQIWASWFFRLHPQHCRFPVNTLSQHLYRSTKFAASDIISPSTVDLGVSALLLKEEGERIVLVEYLWQKQIIVNNFSLNRSLWDGSKQNHVTSHQLKMQSMKNCFSSELPSTPFPPTN